MDADRRRAANAQKLAGTQLLEAYLRCPVSGRKRLRKSLGTTYPCDYQLDLPKKRATVIKIRKARLTERAIKPDRESPLPIELY